MKNYLLILLSGFLVWWLPGRSHAQDIILKIDSISVECSSSDTILVPVRVSNFQNVGSMQFSMQWNVTNLQYLGISGYNPLFDSPAFYLFNDQSVAQGLLSYSWIRQGGLSAPDGSIVFYLAFLRLGGGATPIIFSNQPTPVEFGDVSGLGELPFMTVPGGIFPDDNIPPSITCPPSITLQAPGAAIVNNIAPTSFGDNCGVQNIGWTATGATTANQPADNNASGAVFNSGLSTVTYTVTDVVGLTSTCSFNISILFAPSSDTLTVLAGVDSASCNEQLVIDITALNFDSLTSLQFSVNWDPQIVQFNSLAGFNPALLLNAANFNTFQTGNGLLAFSWTTSDLLTGGTSLPNGSVLFQIVFNLTGNYGDQTDIVFSDNPNVREASSFQQQNEPIPAIWVNGSAVISDNIPPVVTCPANITVDALPGMITADVAGLQPLPLTDNCGGTPSLTYNTSGATMTQGTGNAAGTYSAGTTTVVYTASDAAGNTATCAFTIVVDAGIPVTLAIDTVASDCESVGDTISIPIRVADFDDLFGLLFSIEWNESVLQFVSVSDFYPGLPLNASNFLNFATTPNGILQFFYTNVFSGLPDIPDGGILFQMNFVVQAANTSSGLFFTPPLEAVDSLAFQVPLTVLPGFFATTGDLSPPVITNCPANIMVNTTPGLCSAVFNLPLPTATDACGVIDTILQNPAGNQYNAGITTVTFTAVDDSGNSSTCSIEVNVTESEPPTLSNCPQNVVIAALPDTCVGIANWAAPMATDACTPNGLTLTANYQPGDTLPAGPSVVTYVATDGFGNTSTCTFTVVVEDQTPPTVICPPDLTVATPAGACTAVPNFDFPTGNDNCDQDIDFTLSILPSDTFAIGATAVTYTAFDNFGNSATCSFTVTVADGTPPQINCPPGVTLPTTGNTCSLTILLENIITAEDLCDTDVTITGVNTPANNEYPLGATAVTFQAADGSGNTATCNFTLTVVDTLAPQLTNCPPPLLAVLAGDGCDTTITWPVPTATDNCTLQTVAADYPPGSTFSTGVTVVTYTAIDAGANTATCSFTVTVQDTEAPQFTSPCPKDTVFLNASPCGVDYNWMLPTVSDNCDQMPEVTSTRDTSALFYNGNTVVTIWVFDESGNSDTCKFTVTVSATSAFGFANVPTNLVIQGCSAPVTWIPPVPVGFCGTPQIIATHMPGDTFFAGIDTVIYTAIDSATGIPTSVSFTVTIAEIVAPTFINCPSAPVIVSTSGAVIADPGGFLDAAMGQPGCEEITLEFGTPAATDNCTPFPAVNQTAGGLSGSPFPSGPTTISFTATDNAGNTSVCNVTVVVAPFQVTLQASPNPGCAGQAVVLNTVPIPGADYNWTGPGTGNFTNGPSNTIPVLNTATVGNYSVSASLNGCIAFSNEVNIQFSTLDGAQDDFLFLGPGEDTTLNVLSNDQIQPAGAFHIVEVQNAPMGVTLVDSVAGTFNIASSLIPGEYVFSYRVCAINCPDQCDLANVVLSVRESDCETFPNIITPNGDNLNEYFAIPCLDLSRYPQNTLVIYNQWGDMVYEAAPYTSTLAQGWRGHYLGDATQPLPDGTYFYIFKLSPNDAARKGFIEIFR